MGILLHLANFKISHIIRSESTSLRIKDKTIYNTHKVVYKVKFGSVYIMSNTINVSWLLDLLSILDKPVQCIYISPP